MRVGTNTEKGDEDACWRDSRSTARVLLWGTRRVRTKKKTTKSPKGLLDEFLLHFLKVRRTSVFFLFFFVRMFCVLTFRYIDVQDLVLIAERTQQAPNINKKPWEILTLVD